MLRILFKKPTSVILVFLSLVIWGILAFEKVPISLLPNVDVPKIIIKVKMPNASSAYIENSVLGKFRSSLSSVNKLKDISTISGNNLGLLNLVFEHGTKMDLAYIEVNERIDRILSELPVQIDRPSIHRVNTSDIPVLKLQVIPKFNTNLQELTAFTERVLIKKIEQIEGVSFVDVNGQMYSRVSVSIDEVKLRNYGFNFQALQKVITNAGLESGSFKLKDGQYEYNLNLPSQIVTSNDIGELPISTPEGSIIKLKEIITINEEFEHVTGYHLFDGRPGIVISILKQEKSRMNHLVVQLKSEIEQLKNEYKNIDFYITQDQSNILDAGINNLTQDILIGGGLTVLLLFLFIGNGLLPLILAISIPLSLVLSFILFSLFNLSFNIISLSGLSLGIGMLIDNSIVVLDSILRKRKSGQLPLESSINGVSDVAVPVISQVVTTIAVYAPLIIISGIAGQLIYDQSIALTITLLVSLIVAFIFLPLIILIIFKKKDALKDSDTKVYSFILARYYQLINHVFRYIKIYFAISIILMLGSIPLFSALPVSNLPKTSKSDGVIMINWGEQISIQENLNRCSNLTSVLKKYCKYSETDLGLTNFLLHNSINTIENAETYYFCSSQTAKLDLQRNISAYFKSRYPKAQFSFTNSLDPFTQIFAENNRFLEMKFRPIVQKEHRSDLSGLINDLPLKKYTVGLGLLQEDYYSIQLNTNLLSKYNIPQETVFKKLQLIYGNFIVDKLKRFGSVENIVIKDFSIYSNDKQPNSLVVSNSNTLYPLSNFISFRKAESQKFITSDRIGRYYSVIYGDDLNQSNISLTQIKNIAFAHGFTVDFEGEFIDKDLYRNELFFIFLLVIVLLYFTLLFQYENLVIPLIVMLTIPIGISASLFFLWLSGGTLNIMAGIGLIVVLGLIVDDPILKMEMIKRLEREYGYDKAPIDKNRYVSLIHEAGSMSLKSLLLVSLTTSIAMVPILIFSGLGNDLQRPLAIVIIGGLTVGTFFTLWFVPIAYWIVVVVPRNKRLQKLIN